MKILNTPNRPVIQLMPPAASGEQAVRFTTLCLDMPEGSGRLLYHSLTNELLYLEHDEFPEEYLRTHYFLVEDSFDECAVTDRIRFTLRLYKKATAKGYKTYTILPTTECNARCFYCFELGSEIQTMNEDTVRNVISFIQRTAAKEEITLRFFGGEPLLGESVIDQITHALNDAGITFSSSIVTNAYLFDPEMIRKAKENWRLKDAQITLDGTEAVYNKRKAYLHDKTGAYRKVLRNIEELLAAGIKITVRMNMDCMNCQDLIDLSEQLAVQFGHSEGFHVYPHMLIQDLKSSDAARREETFRLFNTLNERLKTLGLLRKPNLPKMMRLNNCLADDPKAVVILPDGKLHACEHYNENHCFGDILANVPKAEDLAFWEEEYPRSPDCPSCVLYADCVRTKNCPDMPDFCLPQEKERRIARLKEAVRQKVSDL